MNSLIKSVFNAWRNNLFMKINKWFIPLQSSSSHWEQRYPVIILGWLLHSALTEMMLFTLDWLQVFWSPLRSIILGSFNDWYVADVIFNHAMSKFKIIQASVILLSPRNDMKWKTALDIPLWTLETFFLCLILYIKKIVCHALTVSKVLISYLFVNCWFCKCEQFLTRETDMKFVTLCCHYSIPSNTDLLPRKISALKSHFLL